MSYIMMSGLGSRRSCLLEQTAAQPDTHMSTSTHTHTHIHVHKAVHTYHAGNMDSACTHRHTHTHTHKAVHTYHAGNMDSACTHNTHTHTRTHTHTYIHKAVHTYHAGNMDRERIYMQLYGGFCGMICYHHTEHISAERREGKVPRCLLCQILV